MKKSEIYEQIVNAFKEKYDFLGSQVSEEFLLSTASRSIQENSKPDFRIRRHIILFWSHGFLKSSLLSKCYSLLGPDLALMMSDVSHAALRGTVEHGNFISPFVSKRPFGFCSEFGQLMTGSEKDEIIQKLLNVLEEGVVTVSLGKLSSLSDLQREDIEEKYNIKFIDTNTFTYSTNWILMAATYNRKFMVDSAFESRFNIVYPEKQLDGSLTRHLLNAKPFHVDEETVLQFRKALIERQEVDTNIKLPDAIFDLPFTVTPRIAGNALSYILCKAWWGIKVSDDEIVERIKKSCESSEQVWKGADDKVLDCIENEAKSAQQIIQETGLSKRQVYYSLQRIRAIRFLNVEGKPFWKMG